MMHLKGYVVTTPADTNADGSQKVVRAEGPDAFPKFATEFVDGERWRLPRAEAWEDFEARLAETVGQLQVRSGGELVRAPPGSPLVQLRSRIGLPQRLLHISATHF